MTPELQAQLDELYWNTDRSTASIGEELGISRHGLSRLATPLLTGELCWWCGVPLVVRSRTEREGAGRQWPTSRCRCGVRQLHRIDSSRLLDSPAVILVPSPEDISTDQIGGVVDQGIAALARCGSRWSGEFLQIDTSRGPDALREVLESMTSRCIVVPSLLDLGTNEGDALAMFFRLVADGWRIVTSSSLHRRANEGHGGRYGSAYDWRPPRSWSEPGWHDDFVDGWQDEWPWEPR